MRPITSNGLLYAGAYSRELVKKAATLPKYFVIGGKDGVGEYIQRGTKGDPDYYVIRGTDPPGTKYRAKPRLFSRHTLVALAYNVSPIAAAGHTLIQR